MSEQRIRKLDTTTLSAGWARLEQVRFEYLRSDGKWQTQQREIYHRGHGAAILLYNLAQRSVVLTRQFRYPAWSIDGNGFLLEVPAGIVEGDDPLATILAETEQETGFVIAQAEFLYTAYASPGSITEQLHYFAAPYEQNQRTAAGGGLTEEGEDIEVIEMDIDAAMSAVADGGIVDAKTILLLQHAALNLFKRK